MGGSMGLSGARGKVSTVTRQQPEAGLEVGGADEELSERGEGSWGQGTVRSKGQGAPTWAVPCGNSATALLQPGCFDISRA